MVDVRIFKNQTVGVFGLGVAGVAAIRSLVHGGATVFAWDDNADARRAFSADAEIAKHGHLGIAPIESWPWTEFAALIPSPGVPLSHPSPHPCIRKAQEHRVKIMGEVDLLYLTCPDAKYIGITGTNGKSTTTALISHILHVAGKDVQVGANFGTPALALRPQIEHGFYVLEMSSYQLALCSDVLFNASILLNISPDHLDRHGGMDGYFKAKRRIFDRQRDKDAALVGLDDGYCRDIYIDLVREHRQHLIPFSTSQKSERGILVDKDGMLQDLFDDNRRSYDLKKAPTLKGRHNWENIAAAYGCCRYFGILPDVIMDAVYAFPGLPHRLETIIVYNGITFVNDSKATNANAASKALDPYDNIYWIIGGRPKEGGIESLTKYFPKIIHAFLIGEAEEQFARTLRGKVPFTKCGTLEDATKSAARMAMEDQKKGVVMLSPACASFDQFRNFEARGEAFRTYVGDIAGLRKREWS